MATHPKQASPLGHVLSFLRTSLSRLTYQNTTVGRVGILYLRHRRGLALRGRKEDGDAKDAKEQPERERTRVGLDHSSL